MIDTANDRLIFEKSQPGRKGFSLPDCDVPQKPLAELIPEDFLRNMDAALPEVSEPDVMRHYTALSRKNFGVDSGFYPLGSCTMKYNPKINEDIAKMHGFNDVHPGQPLETVQGCLELMFELDRMLSEITGMEKFSLLPAAGAHGEMAGLMMIRAYHESRGDGGNVRRKIIVPDTAHGTNPASATVAGFETIQVKSDDRGNVDLEALMRLLNEWGGSVAGLMLTNPSTLGLFEENILVIADLVHQAGGLLYYDGANANAIMGISRPGDMGFDVVHLNLHKTFSTPHGGGGPGAGPVGVKKDLLPFLPIPLIEKKEDGSNYFFDYDRPLSIGKIKAFYGNFAVIVKAYSYILSMGAEGLKKVSQLAVLNANYLMKHLKEFFLLPYQRICMHEFVLSEQKQKEKTGIGALDMAKRLLDFGYHPPTIYFPLNVKEAMMIEPTETEGKENLDVFAEVMIRIAMEASDYPEILKGAPYNTPVRRLDEAKAVKQLILKYDS
ncbi:MAG: aminomethyl-transferring glycine dehydrogenase subunit GcvPB [Clostridiales bacterium]|nr:aminomethyl-transferring glycine dehydrogenase subunit GcvPB [Clostridiales bacterium]